MSAPSSRMRRCPASRQVRRTSSPHDERVPPPPLYMHAGRCHLTLLPQEPRAGYGHDARLEKGLMPTMPILASSMRHSGGGETLQGKVGGDGDPEAPLLAADFSGGGSEPMEAWPDPVQEQGTCGDTLSWSRPCSRLRSSGSRAGYRRTGPGRADAAVHRGAPDVGAAVVARVAPLAGALALASHEPAADCMHDHQPPEHAPYIRAEPTQRRYSRTAPTTAPANHSPPGTRRPTRTPRSITIERKRYHGDNIRETEEDLLQ